VGWPVNPLDGSAVSRETASLDRPLSADEFREIAGPSATDVERLSAYLALLQRWQRRINLVGASTLVDPWRRHVLDSAQLAPLLPPDSRRLIDLGSGAGFPGLVLAILTSARVCLVEIDVRKCAFLFEAARVTGATVEIKNARIESLAPAGYDVVSARALAPLHKLLEYAGKLLAPNGSCLFLKGRNWGVELTRAAKSWKMRATPIPSWSDPTAVVLKIDDLSRRDDRRAF
jgi:16S rRNA (guanine(527)-N(7))-methyltransferase RsmG